MASRKNLPPPDECAQCGEPIPRRAKACPACGADERTGWRETSIYDGLDLPDEAWADDSASSNRGPSRKRPRPLVSSTGLAWYWWAVTLFLLLSLGFAFLGLR